MFKKIIVHNPNNLKTIDYHKLTILQGDLKTLSKENRTKLCNSIKQHGYFVPAFIWESDNNLYILDATQRYHALEQLEKEGYEIPEIPYIKIEAKNKKDAAEKLLQITSRYGEINPETTFFEDFNIDLEFINDIEIPELDIKLEELEPEIVEDEVPEPPTEPLSKTGDLWILNNRHRILCGDATKTGDLEHLLGDKQIESLITDPPYQAGKPIEGDNLQDAEYIALHKGFIKALPASLKSLISFHSPRTFYVLLDTARQEQWKFERVLWFYEPYTPACGTRAYPWRGWYMQGEIICIFSKNGGSWANTVKYASDTYEHHFKVNSNEGDEEGNIISEQFHPTTKPLWIVADLINHVNGDILDPFLGSGTTLIACEQLNRICYGCEIDPHYIDVILDRYAKFTGDDPIRESDGIKWSELKSSLREQTD